MIIHGTDYHIHEGGLGSTHICIDLYKSGVAWVNKTRAIEKKETWKERNISFTFNECGVEPLVIMEDKTATDRSLDVHHVISAPFKINIIEKGEKL